MQFTRDLVYSHRSLQMRGLLCGEDGRELRPGVVVFHDAMGVGEHVIERSRRLAALGYLTLAADLYGNRMQPRDSAHALELLAGLRNDPPLWRARATAAFEALRALPGVDPGRIAGIGFCFGGSTALELARSGAPLAATVCFHGGLDTSLPVRRGAIQGSVLACTGSADPRVPLGQVRVFLDEMAAAGVDCEVVVHAGAQHSFTNQATNGLPGMAYDARADRRSWAAMRALLDERLGGGSASAAPSTLTP